MKALYVTWPIPQMVSAETHRVLSPEKAQTGL